MSDELERKNEELIGAIQAIEELIEDAISELEGYDTLKAFRKLEKALEEASKVL